MLLGQGALQSQPFLFGRPSPVQISLSAPQVDQISGSTAARLEQARASVEAGNWDDALEALRELANDATDRVVALDERRYVDLRMYCDIEIARLPAEALANYRTRVDPLAEQLYRDGVAGRDEGRLRRIVDEAFCSSWGDDALLALGELALERGDYAAARRWWHQISPLLLDPAGRTAWVALHGVDLAAHKQEVARRWQERPALEAAVWRAYPDTELDLADLRARLILVSIRAGELDRAALELDVFRLFHPESTGRLGGQEGSLPDMLERLLASADAWPAPELDANWPTFSGSTTRGRIAVPLGSLLVPAWTMPIPVESSEPTGLFLRRRESSESLRHYPVVVDGKLLFSSDTSIHAVDMETGRPAIAADGVVHRVDSPEPSAPANISRLAFSVHGASRNTLTVAGGVVYARVGRGPTAQLRPELLPLAERLVGLDLRRDGLMTFRIRPDDPAWSFDGAPVSDGRRVFVTMQHSDVTPHAHVACYDAASGRRLWRRSIGAANTPASGNADEVTHNLLTLVSDRLYLNSNLGLVAALDATDGRIEWIHRYPRATEPIDITSPSSPAYLNRDLSPCLYHDGMLLVAPSDTPAVWAIDADSGRAIWSTDRLSEATDLLGVVENRLVASGSQLWMVDVRTGQTEFVWPESDHAGIRGAGRGVIAGNEIFWPTRREIYVLDASTGSQSRPPIDLSPVGGRGANLIAAEGYLIVVGADRLMALGPPRPAPPEAEPSDQPAAPVVGDLPRSLEVPLAEAARLPRPDSRSGETFRTVPASP